MSAPRDAASVILLRARADRGFEVLLVRRRRGASFMPSACVFPGGGAEARDGGDLRVTAARELFEEAGVLLSPVEIEPAERQALRQHLLADPSAVPPIDPSTLSFWAHWITPSAEPKRFAARFFVAELPANQVATVDNHEAVELVWVHPSEALVRATELALPPPQLRTLWELASLTSIEHVRARAAQRALEPAPILPRQLPDPLGLCLLMPWDPAYVALGTGDALPFATRPQWAFGRSRYRLRDRSWEIFDAPVGTTAS